MPDGPVCFLVQGFDIHLLAIHAQLITAGHRRVSSLHKYFSLFRRKHGFPAFQEMNQIQFVQFLRHFQRDRADFFLQDFYTTSVQSAISLDGNPAQ